jgi:hypothetical protein
LLGGPALSRGDMMGRMQTFENKEPWATESPRLRMRWVVTDEGLRIQWERVTAPPEPIFIDSQDTERFAA